jgi:hypothetical protein
MKKEEIYNVLLITGAIESKESQGTLGIFD